MTTWTKSNGRFQRVVVGNCAISHYQVGEPVDPEKRVEVDRTVLIQQESLKRKREDEDIGDTPRKKSSHSIQLKENENTTLKTNKDTNDIKKVSREEVTTKQGDLKDKVRPIWHTRLPSQESNSPNVDSAGQKVENKKKIEPKKVVTPKYSNDYNEKMIQNTEKTNIMINKKPIQTVAKTPEAKAKLPDKSDISRRSSRLSRLSSGNCSSIKTEKMIEDVKKISNSNQDKVEIKETIDKSSKSSQMQFDDNTNHENPTANLPNVKPQQTLPIVKSSENSSKKNEVSSKSSTSRSSVDKTQDKFNERQVEGKSHNNIEINVKSSNKETHEKREKSLEQGSNRYASPSRHLRRDVRRRRSSSKDRSRSERRSERYDHHSRSRRSRHSHSRDLNEDRKETRSRSKIDRTNEKKHRSSKTRKDKEEAKISRSASVNSKKQKLETIKTKSERNDDDMEEGEISDSSTEEKSTSTKNDKDRHGRDKKNEDRKRRSSSEVKNKAYKTLEKDSKRPNTRSRNEHDKKHERSKEEVKSEGQKNDQSKSLLTAKSNDLYTKERRKSNECKSSEKERTKDKITFITKDSVEDMNTSDIGKHFHFLYFQTPTLNFKVFLLHINQAKSKPIFSRMLYFADDCLSESKEIMRKLQAEENYLKNEVKSRSTSSHATEKPSKNNGAKTGTKVSSTSENLSESNAATRRTSVNCTSSTCDSEYNNTSTTTAASQKTKVEVNRSTSNIGFGSTSTTTESTRRTSSRKRPPSIGGESITQTAPLKVKIRTPNYARPSSQDEYPLSEAGSGGLGEKQQPPKENGTPEKKSPPNFNSVAGIASILRDSLVQGGQISPGSGIIRTPPTSEYLQQPISFSQNKVSGILIEYL